jgi:hypothetical protein
MAYTFQEAMAAYKNQTTTTQRLVHRFASQKLIDQGAQEVGTSDINHSIQAIFSEYQGNFEEAARHFVNTYLIK